MVARWRCSPRSGSAPRRLHEDVVHPTIFRNVVRNDSGAAPRPYGGYCSLSICKPAVRRTAQVGDWVIGLRSHHPGEVIHAMAGRGAQSGDRGLHRSSTRSSNGAHPPSTMRPNGTAQDDPSACGSPQDARVPRRHLGGARRALLYPGDQTVVLRSCRRPRSRGRRCRGPRAGPLDAVVAALPAVQ